MVPSTRIAQASSASISISIESTSPKISERKQISPGPARQTVSSLCSKPNASYAPIQPGNSGGPVLDQSGNVVGVVVGKLDAIKAAAATNDIAQNVNFAIKTTVLTTFLESNGVSYLTGVLGQILQPPDLAERVKSISVLVRCE
jgi:hypothetical protein